MEKITVVAADDHKIVRDCIVAVLNNEPDIDVVDVADTGLEAVRKVEKYKPDVIVMDLSMPDLSGIEATRRIKQYVPTTEVIALSMYNDEQHVVGATQAGVKGYIVKEDSYSVLVNAIRMVNNGKRYFSPSVSDAIVKAIQRGGTKNGGKIGILTPREREVLTLIAQGYKNKEIAKKLFRQPKTVANHRANIMEKLDIHDGIGLANFARANGLIPNEVVLRKKI